ncbi:MAG: glycosyltransferase family 39 protein [Victivallaceae bacterium]|nr:glycosyltransferase family 39 protein [Victivallaceae bacterium]
MSVKTSRFINRNFSCLIYIFSLLCLLLTLCYARTYGLLPRPVPGTDQLSMLKAAEDLTDGKLPGAGYMYSYLYTVFLYVLNLPAMGNLVAMRALQAAVCALVPVFIYKLCRRLRFGGPCSRLAALFYCFYGPAALISLSFLRAVPLALCFVLAANYLVSAFIRRKNAEYFIAGIFMGMCILGRENFIPVAAAPLAMLLYPAVRKHIKKSFVLYYAAGTAVLLIPVLIYNTVMFSSVSLVPGHWQNVMGAYHSNAAGNAARAAGSIIAGFPVQALNYLSSYEIPNSLSFYAHREIIEFLNIFILPFNFFTAISLAILCFRFRDKAIAFPGLLIAAYAASMLPFTMFYRFRIPGVPLLCCLSSAALIIIIREFARKKYFRAGGPLLLFLVLFILTASDSWELRPMSEKRSAVLVLIRNKRYHDAVKLIDKMPPGDMSARYLKVALLKSLDADGERSRAAEIHGRWMREQRELQKMKKSGAAP